MNVSTSCINTTPSHLVSLAFFIPPYKKVSQPMQFAAPAGLPVQDIQE
jgi:hypothetical protein